MDEQDEEVVSVELAFKEPLMPSMAVVMVIIGVVTIIGGAILCGKLWPGDAGYGYSWEATAYVPALTWLFSSIISAMLFFAFAAALTYLHDISEYAKTIAYNYGNVTESKEDKEQRQREQSEMEEWRRQTKLHPRKLDK